MNQMSDKYTKLLFETKSLMYELKIKNLSFSPNYSLTANEKEGPRRLVNESKSRLSKQEIEEESLSQIMLMLFV